MSHEFATLAGTTVASAALSGTLLSAQLAQGAQGYITHPAAAPTYDEASDTWSDELTDVFPGPGPGRTLFGRAVTTAGDYVERARQAVLGSGITPGDVGLAVGAAGVVAGGLGILHRMRGGAGTMAMNGEGFLDALVQSNQVAKIWASGWGATLIDGRVLTIDKRGVVKIRRPRKHLVLSHKPTIKHIGKAANYLEKHVKAVAKAHRIFRERPSASVQELAARSKKRR